MEFEGRIVKVLPMKSGISIGEWKALPFVFEYFEKGDDRWSDKVLLETMDPTIMGKIGAYVERGKDGKGIVENGSMKLKSEIHCRCGFSHNVREWTDKDGKTNYFNKLRIYKFEIVKWEANRDTATTADNFVIRVQEQPKQEASDDLPF